MKAIQFSRFGKPTEVAECVDVEEPAPPGAGEVLISVEASPINPSDLLTLSGEYGRLPQLPATPGNEGVGRVLSVGSGVTHLKQGDRVLLPLGARTWRERLTADATRTVKLPETGDPLQLSMIAVNPPTALLMLKLAPLKPGDWVIQNAANSAVGQYLITFARQQGLKTINLVRREMLVAPLKAMGADVVLVDGEDLQKRVRVATGGGQVGLGIDAVGGAATQRLASAVSPGGTVVNYGMLSGEVCHMAPADLIFRGITLTGFWLTTWFTRTPADEVRRTMQTVVDQVAGGALHAKVEATYPLTQITDAVRHAGQPGREGKVLLVPTER